MEDAELKIRYSCINYIITPTLYGCKSILRFDEFVMKSSEFEWLLYLVLVIIKSCVPDGRFVNTIHDFRILSFFCSFVFFLSVHPAHNLFTHVRNVIKILCLLF